MKSFIHLVKKHTIEIEQEAKNLLNLIVSDIEAYKKAGPKEQKEIKTLMDRETKELEELIDDWETWKSGLVYLQNINMRRKNLF